MQPNKSEKDVKKDFLDAVADGDLKTVNFYLNAGMSVNSKSVSCFPEFLLDEFILIFI